ncbi:hypothetical protein Sliba_05320 [Streptomyces nigrescens]|uniref:Uncharacterized protein n=1 Tax=Streptomyces nigrescens TaxID=1920 RepID=A0A640T8K7_STRNI|nr:hypothetical protein Sliba_05320 [Streptomyces libani subsp. libani]GGV85787.1 hypothetical protein GCM10010500_02850 [Streptomyces libani subsp. libani]
MALACPRCRDHHQVLDLPEFWKSLPRESELRGKYAQPAEYAAQWILPLAAVLLGVVALVSGAVAAGLLLLAGGGGIGFWLSRLSSAAEEARERWARSLICRQCPATFLREDAVSV